MRKATLFLAVVVVSLASTASLASAAATFQPSGAVAYTGTNVGSFVLTYAGGTPSVSCSSFTGTGAKSAGTPSTLVFNPAFSGCITTVISTRPANIAPSCAWTFHLGAATFNSGTGATIGVVLSTCGNTVITVPSIPACRTTIAAQSITTGITAQNRTLGDVANAPLGGAPFGHRAIATAGAVSYTSAGCPGVSSGTGSVAFSLYFGGVWIG